MTAAPAQGEDNPGLRFAPSGLRASVKPACIPAMADWRWFHHGLHRNEQIAVICRAGMLP